MFLCTACRGFCAYCLVHLLLAFFFLRIKRRKVEILESSLDVEAMTSQEVEIQTSGNAYDCTLSVHLPLMIDTQQLIQLIFAC